uniref:Uncharacterized protein n=1 Tax=Arundo donax TaxID=35708 RepID=A0A0A8ZA49_ARUDO
MSLPRPSVSILPHPGHPCPRPVVGWSSPCPAMACRDKRSEHELLCSVPLFVFLSWAGLLEPSYGYLASGLFAIVCWLIIRPLFTTWTEAHQSKVHGHKSSPNRSSLIALAQVNLDQPNNPFSNFQNY